MSPTVCNVTLLFQHTLCVLSKCAEREFLDSSVCLQSVVRLRRKCFGVEHVQSGPAISFWGHPPREQRRRGGVVARPSPQPPSTKLPRSGSHPQPQEVRVHIVFVCRGSIISLFYFSEKIQILPQPLLINHS